MADSALSTMCDSNNGARDGILTDGGTFTDMNEMPIHRYWYGDTGSSFEHSQLILGDIYCEPQGYAPVTSCAGKPQGPAKIKPIGASGLIYVTCDGNGKATVDFSHNTGVSKTGPLGHAASESACVGLFDKFEYKRAGASGQSEVQIRNDLKKFVEASGSCKQDFTYGCRDSLLSDYQCLGPSKTPMSRYAHSKNCDANDATFRYDTGTVTDAHGDLPVTQWFYGDTGSEHEENSLKLGSLICTP